MAGRRPAHLSGDRAADRGPHPRQDRRRLGLPQWRSKLAAYVGLAPVTRQSGTSLADESRSRRGNRRLKNAMFLAVFASLRDPASKAFYDRKRAEGKRHNAAVICLARRRCDVILAMLGTRLAYQSTRHAPSLADAA
jgi:Transposase IS116/IS110/IS902 family